MYFTYRLLLFTRLVDQIIKLIPKLLLVFLYLILVGTIIQLYIAGFTMKNFNNAFFHPFETITYLFKYLKSWWKYKESLGITGIIKIVIFFYIPYLAFQIIKKLLHLITYKIRIFFIKLKIKIKFKIQQIFKKKKK